MSKRIQSWAPELHGGQPTAMSICFKSSGLGLFIGLQEMHAKRNLQPGAPHYRPHSCLRIAGLSRCGWPKQN
jgi:hypothetical protein